MADGQVGPGLGGEEPAFGPSPMHLLRLALGGCTAMDVVYILRKMRQPLPALSVEVVGEKAEQVPKRYT